MDYSQEILTALESSNRAFEKFKNNITHRLDGLENAHAKGHRPLFGISVASDPETKAATEAFGRYLKTGDKSEIKSMSTSSGPDGGFAVPKVIDSMIETLLLPQSPIRGYATVRQISTPDYHSLVNIRGSGASWVGETASRPATDTPQLKDIAPPMGEIYANFQASQQMLDDVFFDAGSWLAQEAADTFGASEDDKFLNGTGVNQPLGILTYPTAATADATRAFGTLQYVPSGDGSGFAALNTSTGVSPLDAFQKTVFSMHPGYRGDAVWLMNSTTLAAVSVLKDSLGRFLVQPSILAGQLPMLLGFPVVEAQHMPDIAGNAYPIAFANLKRGYLIADRIGTRVLVDPFSNKPNVGYYVTRRLGACVNNSRCIKLLKIAAS